MSFNLVIIGSLLIAAIAESTGLSELRQYFEKAEKDKTYAEKLKTATAGNDKAIFKAYHGSAWALLAKHHFNPYKKLEYLKKGLIYLNASAMAEANDIEIRFLRFSVEENIPSFVSFTSHVQTDKTFILANLKSSHPFYITMKEYLKTSKSLSDSEKKNL